MSTVLRPQGPQKATTYWRRRLVVLVAALAVLLTLGYLLFGGADPQDQAEAAPTPTTNASPSPGPSPEGTAESSAEPSANPAAAPACQESGIAVVVATDRDSYAEGVNPQITLTIRNDSATDCLRDIGSGANEVVITSGGQHVWSSDDCDPSQASNEQVLDDGAEAAVTLTWERKLSAPGCAGQATAAQPGSYQVEGRNGSAVSDPVRFVLQ